MIRRYIAFILFCLIKTGSLIFGTIYSNIRLFLSGVNCRGFVTSFGILRTCIYPHAKITIGKHCNFRGATVSNVAGILHPCFLSAIGRGCLTIGDGCGFSGTIIVAEDSVTIGNHVFFGVNCTIYDTDFHPVDFATREKGERGKTAPVLIQDHVWLGANVIVLKGVTIGENSVIAANSVVTSNIPANVIAGGCPAKVIKKL